MTQKEAAELYQDFFNFLNQEHNLICTSEQMDEILYEAQKQLHKFNSHFPAPYESLSDDFKKIVDGIENNLKKESMKDFENRLKNRIKELPFTNGVDDRQYNDGLIDGFEQGAHWAMGQTREDLLAILMKEDEKDVVYQTPLRDTNTYLENGIKKNLPHPDCDETCYFTWCKGGVQPPDCVKQSERLVCPETRKDCTKTGTYSCNRLCQRI